MGASSGGAAAPSIGAGAGAGLDLMSNANLAQMPDVSFGTGQQPAGVGIANNIVAGMPTGVAGSVPTSPMAQNQMGAIGNDQKKPFDFQGLAKDLGEVSKEQAAQQPSMTPVNTQAAGAGQGGLPNFYAGMMAPQGMSGAMQAIQQGQGSGMPMGIMGAMQQPKGY